LSIPVIVLVNDNSASASEIVAGSLQDLDRAVIVGERSFGKGLVQRTYDLSYGAKVKLTIAKYYTPSGRCVQRLEYYDKKLEDNPKEIPDSLITIFKTRNGREVIDGRGVDPDVLVEQDILSRLTGTMLGNNIIFNFTTDYYYAHPEISSASDFGITDEEYDAFKEYVLKQDFTYSTASEEMLKKVKETAEKEEYFEDAEKEYEALLSLVTPSKERDLNKFESEIKAVLNNEIVSRYYYQKGRAENAFVDDKNIKMSKEILHNLERYNTILGN
jgi:carboxyl-terminal processing protease